ncbi:P-loop containing nucleoside triphosphate hydrolase protein [Mycena galericulata]|nr:P-loop containing nucleoside triphosphate hydrolase protein [Mycena galericulata]
MGIRLDQIGCHWRRCEDSDVGDKGGVSRAYVYVKGKPRDSSRNEVDCGCCVQASARRGDEPGLAVVRVGQCHHRLRERFMSDTMYTSLGTSAVVTLNPNNILPYETHYSRPVYRLQVSFFGIHSFSFLSAALRQEGCRLARRMGPPAPRRIHARRDFAMRLCSYPAARTYGDVLSICPTLPPAPLLHYADYFCSGETASGKSIKNLLELSVSSPGKKGSKLATQVPATELQFSDRGRLQGIKTLDCYLERNRISGTPNGERNLNIFYYLVASATPEERQHLPSRQDDVPVSRPAPRPEGPERATPTDDALRFDQLKGALKTIGLSKRHVATRSADVPACRLGNLEFTIDRSRNEDVPEVRDTDVCEIVADFLGVDPGDPEQALSYKTKLDDFGPSSSAYSTFGPAEPLLTPQLAQPIFVNFANEHLPAWTQHRLFEAHMAEYMTEGLVLSVFPVPTSIPYFDKGEYIRLLQNRLGGLVHIMDDQVRRAPKKMDRSMMETFAKRWGNHSSFKTSAGTLGITISHFSGPVTFSAEGFLARNLDALNPDFVSLLHAESDASTGGTVDPFAHACTVDAAEECTQARHAAVAWGADGAILEDGIDGGAEEGAVGTGSSSGGFWYSRPLTFVYPHAAAVSEKLRTKAHVRHNWYGKEVDVTTTPVVFIESGVKTVNGMDSRWVFHRPLSPPPRLLPRPPHWHYAEVPSAFFAFRRPSQMSEFKLPCRHRGNAAVDGMLIYSTLQPTTWRCSSRTSTASRARGHCPMQVMDGQPDKQVQDLRIRR